MTLLLLLLLAYAKKDFFSSLIFLASLHFKLFLSFFIETLACRLPWTMPVALIKRPTAPADRADVVFTQTGVY